MFNINAAFSDLGEGSIEKMPVLVFWDGPS